MCFGDKISSEMQVEEREKTHFGERHLVEEPLERPAVSDSVALGRRRDGDLATPFEAGHGQ